jgi:MFS family permease
LFITIGILLAYCFGYGIISSSLDDEWKWKVMSIVGAFAPLGLLLLAIFVMPESLIWRDRKAQEQISRAPLLSTNSLEGSAVTPVVRSAWSELLLSRYHRKSLIVGLILGIALSATGINAVMFYAPTILGDSTIDDDDNEEKKCVFNPRFFSLSDFKNNESAQYLIPILIGGWNVICTIVATFLVDRLGRKPLLVGGLLAMIIAGVSLGAVQYQVVVVNHTHASTGLNAAAIVFMLLFIAGFAVGPGATFWVLVNENFPAEIRSQGGR